MLQEHCSCFDDMLRWRIISPASRGVVELPSDRLVDLQRAARFLYLERLEFGGKLGNRNFGADRRTLGRFGVTKLQPMPGNLHERLANNPSATQSSQ